MWRVKSSSVIAGASSNYAQQFRRNLIGIAAASKFAILNSINRNRVRWHG